MDTPHSSRETGAMDAERLNSNYWLQHRDKLFLASCIALIVTAMSFAIRGALIAPLGEQFNLSKEQMGYIVGTAFWGFALATVIGGSLCDVLGMGRLLTLAFIGHLLGIVLTILASGFWTLFISTLFFGLANGIVEAACNPLIATLYPDQKIKRLSLFHAWFPGGIVIGGLTAFAIQNMGIGGEDNGWKLQMASMLIPLAIYGAMFLGKKFPQTERAASNISSAQMFRECLRPFFLLFVFCMLLTAATELVTGQWMPDILTVTTGISGILYLVIINGLMAVGRSFGGPLAHRLSPVGVLIGSAIFSGIGLFLLSRANDLTSGIVAAVVFAVGVCFFWPTMLGVVSERFPKSGALGMSITGGAGMLSTAVFLPIVGHRYDAATAGAAGGADKFAALQAAAAQPGAAASVKSQLSAALAEGGQVAMQTMLYLPIILTVIFTAIYLYDKSRGGYKEEVLIQEQQQAAA
ncbi:MAG TPA: MFS transporter [Abditibacteriaceae bacterium]